MTDSELPEIIELYKKMDYDGNGETLMKFNKQNLYEKFSVISEIHNAGITTASYIEFLQKHRDTIRNFEYYENFKTHSETIKHIELAIKYLRALNDADFKTSEEVVTYKLTYQIPLYELIIGLYNLIKFYKNGEITTDGRRKKLVDLFLNENSSSSKSATKFIDDLGETAVSDRYTSMVVYETSDVETATDVLSTSFHENSLPWKIRDVYIQESVYEKFTIILKSKLKPFDACYREDKLLADSYSAAIRVAQKMGLSLIRSDVDDHVMKPTVVVGQNRSYFDKHMSSIPLFINLNIFRTVKESIDMINRNPNLTISLWTEHISPAYEFINKVNTSCIWINSLGIFNTKVPFPFDFLLSLKGNGTANQPSSFGIIELADNVQFQCFKNAGSEKNTEIIPSRNDCKIVKTIYVNSCRIEFNIDTAILKRPEESNNFELFSYYKTVVIPFGVTFGN